MSVQTRPAERAASVRGSSSTCRLNSVSVTNGAVVLDASGSMVGQRIATVRDAVTNILQGLDSTSRIRIVLFSTNTVTYPQTDELLAATPGNIAGAIDFTYWSRQVLPHPTGWILPIVYRWVGSVLIADCKLPIALPTRLPCQILHI